MFCSYQLKLKLFLSYNRETLSKHNLVNEKSHLTPITRKKPFDAACASNIQEKPHATSHALRNLTHAFNRMRLIEGKIVSSGYS